MAFNADLMNANAPNPDDDFSELPANPFVGLRPFDTKDELLFFGRDEQTTELMLRLARGGVEKSAKSRRRPDERSDAEQSKKRERGRFVAVVGSSGCGKSSLIRAGLIPKLKSGFIDSSRDQWRFVKMKPGKGPIMNLAASLLASSREPRTENSVGALAGKIRLAGAQAIVEYLSERVDASDTNVLLLVDQFEEIFRFGFHADEGEAGEAPDRWKQRRDEAAEFVSTILELARQESPHVYVVITMRSDFLSDCDEFYGLPQALNEGLYLVPRLTRSQRRDAIECPLRLYGEEISAGLLDRILNDMGTGPEQAPKGKEEETDELPVMQHAMMRTWENWLEESKRGEQEGRKRGPLDLRHYENIGGFEGALSMDADNALHSLDENEQTTAKLMFQALTDTDAKGRRLRRPVRLGALAEITGSDTETVKKIIKRFRDDNRLFLTPWDDRLNDDDEERRDDDTALYERLNDDTLIDISHESLIRRWKRLNEWVDEEAAAREQYMSLAGKAVSYFASEGRKTSLLRDPELQFALNWWATFQPNEAWARRYYKSEQEFAVAEQFLRASEQAEKDKAAREDEERKRELVQARRLARKRLATTIAFLILSILLLGAFAYAKRQESTAASNAEEAKANAAKAEAAAAEAVVNAARADVNAVTAKANEEIARAGEETLKTERNKLKDKTIELEKQKRREETAKNDLNKTVKDLTAEKSSHFKDNTRGAVYTNYNYGLKAEKESNFKRARFFYLKAIEQFDVKDADGNLVLTDIEDKLALADVHAALGKLMFKPEYDPADTEGTNPQDSTGKLADVHGLLDVALGNGTPEAKEAALSRFNLRAPVRGGLTSYGQAVSIFRQIRAFAESASLLETLGESFDPTEETYDPSGNYSQYLGHPNSLPTDEASYARTQAAISLFCEAYADYAKADNPEKESQILLRIGHRLDAGRPQPMPNGNTPPLKLVGCVGIGPVNAATSSEPTNYFDKALDRYKDFITKLSFIPEEQQKRYEAATSTAIDIAKIYLARNDVATAERYFMRAENFYNKDDSAQQESLVLLLAEISGIYRDNRDDPKLKEAGEDLADAINIYNKMSSEQRKKVAKTLAKAATELGSAYLGQKGQDDQAKYYFDQAAGLYGTGELADATQRDNKSEVLLDIGKAYQSNELTIAIAYFNQAAEVFFPGGKLENATAEASKSAAEAYIKGGDSLPSDEGRDSELYFKAAEAYHNAADSYRKTADTEKEAEMLRLELSILDRSADILTAQEKKGGLGRHLNDLLVKHYERILTLDQALKPTHRVSTLTSLASVYVEVKRVGDAIKAYGKALQLIGDDKKRDKADVYLGRGNAWKLLHLWGRAENDYNEARRLYGDVNSTTGLETVARELADLQIKRQGVIPPTPLIAVDTKISLTGASSIEGKTPKGDAELKFDEENHEKMLTVSVNHVDLAPGTVLEVFINDRLVGPLKLLGDKQRGKLVLDTAQAEKVPDIPEGARVVVKLPRSQGGATVVEGSFPMNPTN